MLKDSDHKLKLQKELLKSLNANFDKFSPLKIVKICSKTNFSLNNELRQKVIDLINQKGKLNEAMSDAKFLKSYALSFIDQVKGELKPEVLADYL